MLTKRIIPCLDVHEGRVVKGIQFIDLVDAGDPVIQAQWYNEEGADELVFLDITATSDNRKSMMDVIERTASSVFIPLTVGGGIRTLDDMKRMLDVGADKISINSSALADPNLISQGAERFGSQCVVLAIDVKKNESGNWEVYSHGGRKPTGKNAIEWALEGVKRGAGELLITSMDKDGSKSGYDLDILAQISEQVPVPVIASGGAGKPEHLLDAFTIGKADAVLAASIFHFREYSISTVKTFLRSHGIPVRAT